MWKTGIRNTNKYETFFFLSFSFRHFKQGTSSELENWAPEAGFSNSLATIVAVACIDVESLENRVCRTVPNMATGERVCVNPCEQLWCVLTLEVDLSVIYCFRKKYWRNCKKVMFKKKVSQIFKTLNENISSAKNFSKVSLITEILTFIISKALWNA